MDLGLTNVIISSPAAAALLVAVRPAVTFTNSGSMLAYITGTIQIMNKASGLIDFSSVLSCVPVAPGQTATALAAADWTPTPGASYAVSAVLFASNADTSETATPAPITVTTPGSAPSPTTRKTIKITYPGQPPIYILAAEETPPVIEYPFYLEY